MSLKERVKTYNFWVSLASAIFLIINIIGQKFNFYVDEGIFNDLFTAICAILVLLGIIVPPKTKANISVEKLLNENFVPEPETAEEKTPDTIDKDQDVQTQSEEPILDDAQSTCASENEFAFADSSELCANEIEPQTDCQEQSDTDPTEQSTQSFAENQTNQVDEISRVCDDQQATATTESEDNILFSSLLKQQIETFSGSKEELKQILYSEIERLGE